jgi:hypothetical protein
VLDDYGRAVAGYALSLHNPSSTQTALALRQGIWRKGDARCRCAGFRTSSLQTMEVTSPASSGAGGC